jgi:hypothetical protein
MRVWICLVLAACQAPPPAVNEPVSTPAEPSRWLRASPWLSVRTGQLAAVSVERALYTAAPAASFFIRVRIENRIASPIWVWLPDDMTFVYPNQWERSKVDHREIVDELLAVPGPIDPDLVRNVATTGNTSIEVGGSLDVYRGCEGLDAVDAASGRWMLVALAGRVVTTDGARVEDLKVMLDDDYEASRLLVVSAAPLVWHELPAQSRVMEGRS